MFSAEYADQPFLSPAGSDLVLSTRANFAKPSSTKQRKFFAWFSKFRSTSKYVPQQEVHRFSVQPSYFLIFEILFYDGGKRHSASVMFSFPDILNIRESLIQMENYIVTNKGSLLEYDDNSKLLLGKRHISHEVKTEVSNAINRIKFGPVGFTTYLVVDRPRGEDELCVAFEIGELRTSMSFDQFQNLISTMNQYDLLTAGNQLLMIVQNHHILNPNINMGRELASEKRTSPTDKRPARKTR